MLILFSRNFIFADEFSITPSFRIHPNTTAYQSEPIIVVSPLNPQVMFCSAFTINIANILVHSEGIYVTTNGGLNWFGNDTCTGAPIGNHGGDPGITIDKNGVFLLYHIYYAYYTTNATVYTHYSTNMGTTWSNQYQLYNPIQYQATPEDKGTITTDNSASSPYYGRSYASWVIYSAPYPVYISYTTNSGMNWSTNAQINPGPPKRCSGGELKTGSDGTVYDTWAGVSDTTPFAEIWAGFASSTNGGVSWNFQQIIFDMRGISGFLPQKNSIRVNGIPRMAIDPANSWIYIVTNEINNSPAGSDPDIIFHRSTNKGQSWSPGIRVNQDPLNNGKIQYFPAICVDSTGAINVLYYDDRNTTSDSAQVFMSRSTNGGNTWYDFQVSDKTFKPDAIPGGPQHYQGDFISLTSANNKLYPVWMANYTGTYQIWMTILDISLIGIKKISSEVPVNFELKQNYPNPFNPSTKIKFDIPDFPLMKGVRGMTARLTIYDILGREITTLVNAQLQPGSYEVTWDASDKPSGVYFYELITDSYKMTKKMLMIK
jgi:hypothetical protein